MRNDSLFASSELRRHTLRCSVAPRRDKRRAQHGFCSSLKSHVRGAAKSPTALYRRKNLGMIVHEFLLLLWRQLHHSQTIAGIRERREDFPAHSKIRMVHVRALGCLGKAKRHAAKIFGSHAVSPSREFNTVAKLRNSTRASFLLPITLQVAESNLDVLRFPVAADHRFEEVGSRERKIGIEHNAHFLVKAPNALHFPVVKKDRRAPWLVPSRAREAVDEILRVRRPSSFHHAESMFAIGRRVFHDPNPLPVLRQDFNLAFRRAPRLFAARLNFSAQRIVGRHERLSLLSKCGKRSEKNEDEKNW